MKKQRKKFGLCIIICLLSLLLLLSACSKKQLNKKDVVNLSLKTVLIDKNFNELSSQEKYEKVNKELEKLSEEGLIKEGSIVYNEDEELFCFEYSDGSLGGILLKEFSDEINIAYTDSEQSDDNTVLNEVKNGENALILNGFEDNSYRRDYYKDLKANWEKSSLNTDIDIDVTIDDLKNLSDYSIIIFAMHGSMYKDVPVLCINQVVTKETNEKYKDEISKKLVAQVTYLDGTSGYWILPEFFTYNYQENEMKNKLIFSESCMFFGCDCKSTSPDFSMANALDKVSTGVIIGYHNSVGANYSREVMKFTVDTAMEGKTISDSLEAAKDIYGDDDNYENIQIDKYCAYPILVGNGQTRILEKILEDFSLPSKINLKIGTTSSIEPEKIIPTDATGYFFEWTSSDDSIVSLASNIGNNAIITAKKKGTATVTATYRKQDGSEISKTIDIKVATEGRDTILVLDVSGSMYGTPISEMKKAAIKFCGDLLNDDSNNRVGLVLYDTGVYTVDLTDNLDYLIDYISSIDAGSRTNMQGGLEAAETMLDNQGKSDNIKNIVIMADGLPNEGKTSETGAMSKYTTYASYSTDVSYANGVVAQAESIMKKYNLYCLGFFHSLYGLEKDFATDLMKLLTNMPDGYHQVDKAENLQFAFGDIQETISDGSKVIINIACPVDVTVVYNGEKLSSVNGDSRASFGSLQLLGKNKDIKVFSLDPDKEYDISMNGTDNGTMNYSVNYLDIQGNIVASRTFNNVPVTPTSKYISNTDKNMGSMDLNIDNDGDGNVDEIWSANKNGEITITTSQETVTTPTEETTVPVEPVPKKENSSITALIVFLTVIIIGIIVFVIVFLVNDRKKKKLHSKNNKVVLKKEKNCTEKQYRNLINDKTSDLIGESVSEYNKSISQVTDVIGKITVKTGDLFGKEFTLNDNILYKIGRDKNSAEILLSESYEKVGRTHCSIMFKASCNSFYITDFSQNGTYLKNGRRLNAGETTEIPAKNAIILSDKNCEIYLNGIIN